MAPAVAAVLPGIAAAVDLAVAALDGGRRRALLRRRHLRPDRGHGRRRAATDVRAGARPGRRPPRRRAPTRSTPPSRTSRTTATPVPPTRGSMQAGDVAVGLTASGRTPYVAGALAEARRIGAHTVLVSANPAAEAAAVADVHICVETGPEVLAGSTRMKAGTAQKLVLNAFSTATMVRLGHTYSNLMTGVVAKNAKLHGRMVGILAQATGHDLDACARVLQDSGGDLKLALVRLLADGRRRPRPHRPRRGRRRRPHRPAPPRRTHHRIDRIQRKERSC